jgi:hypothetical protein
MSNVATILVTTQTPTILLLYILLLVQDGKLSMDEALALINSEEVAAAVKQGTGMDHTTRTAADIQTWFKRAGERGLLGLCSSVWWLP